MTNQLEQESRWKSVVSRDKQADGQFFYGVATTKIYCRPSCASRQPNRENVVFFQMPTAAEDAGFRPCKRCKPREIVLQDARVQLVQTVCDYIHANIDSGTKLTLAEIGLAVQYDPQYVQEVFKVVLQMTPRQYTEAVRVQQLKQNLREESNVTDAIYATGFGSSSRVYERADRAIGMTPATYRKGGEGVEIRYTVTECYLGQMLIGMTERGICAVGIYDDEEQAEKALFTEYPQAEITHDDAELNAIVSSILAYVDGTQPSLDLPLDVQATAFQWRVWQELQRIPRGETRSYSEIAQALGQPSATRAVANACGSNKAAIIIPCHRVVGKDGQLTGYRWGIERKRQILEQEAKQPIRK